MMSSFRDWILELPFIAGEITGRSQQTFLHLNISYYIIPFHAFVSLSLSVLLLPVFMLCVCCILKLWFSCFDFILIFFLFLTLSCLASLFDCGIGNNLHYLYVIV